MDTNKTFTLVAPARLEGYGVRLREWADTDLADLVALYDDPEMARWTPVASPFDLDAARAYLAGAREGQAEGRKIQLAVTTDGLLPRGEVLLFRSGSDERDLELAYGVGPAHRGRGSPGGRCASRPSTRFGRSGPVEWCCASTPPTRRARRSPGPVRSSSRTSRRSQGCRGAGRSSCARGGCGPETPWPCGDLACQSRRMDHAEVLLLGGRAGVGKTTVGWEVSARLRAAHVAHAVIDGDFMGQVHPAPEGDPRRAAIAERNLTAVWGNYAELGYRRLVYTNTVSVLEESTGVFRRAMGDGVRIVRVLLTASDETTERRLAGRELGSELEEELRGSARKARMLDERAPVGTLRVVTDGRTVIDIAAEVTAATGWVPERVS